MKNVTYSNSKSELFYVVSYPLKVVPTLLLFLHDQYNECMHPLKSGLLLISIIYSLSYSTYAQLENYELGDFDQQFWIDYNITYAKTEKFNIYGDTGFRIISPYTWNRYYARSGISYTPKPLFKNTGKLKTTYHFGIGIFFTNYVYIPNNLEIRPFQGVQIQWPSFKNITFTHYARLEQQIENFNNTWEFGVRARYMLSAVISWGEDKKSNINNLYIPLHVEIFWNLENSSSFTDVIRMTIGLGYEFNSKWNLEFLPSYHLRRFQELDDVEVNDLVFRLRVFHTLKF